MEIFLYILISTSLSHLCPYQKIQYSPSGAVVKNLPANAGDTGSVRGLGRSHMPRSN